MATRDHEASLSSPRPPAMNITRGEWAEKEAEIRAAMTARYPWLVKGGGKGLRFENRAMAANLELDLIDGEHMRPTMAVGSGSTPGRDVEAVCVHAHLVIEMRDAMLAVTAMISDIVVWPSGKCPCSSCSGRGSSQGTPCERCDGKGVR